VFGETLHKTNTWLKEIMGSLGPDRRRAYRALRAVLHTLRDRLTIDGGSPWRPAPDAGSRDLLRSVAPGRKTGKVRSLDDFLAPIASHFATARPIDPEDAARAVFQVLETHVAPGEIRDVINVLPQEIRTLWPHPQHVS
jgi:uncharacterized protein (DUF2267 family)